MNQLELNKKLQNALDQKDKDIDLSVVEECLKEGANPMGYADDPDDTVFGYILWLFGFPGEEKKLAKLPQITKLFVDYGMKIEDDPNHRFDGNHVNPLWSMFFCASEPAAEALEMLLDNGLSAEIFEKFVDHVYTDFGHVMGSNYEITPDLQSMLDDAFKMVFLGASYPHIIENSEYIRECISYNDNSYDLAKFRKWNDFTYEYDFSTGRILQFGLDGVGITIREKSTGNVVWHSFI